MESSVVVMSYPGIGFEYIAWVSSRTDIFDTCAIHCKFNQLIRSYCCASGKLRLECSHERSLKLIIQLCSCAHLWLKACGVLAICSRIVDTMSIGSPIFSVVKVALSALKYHLSGIILDINFVPPHIWEHCSLTYCTTIAIRSSKTFTDVKISKTG